MCFLQINKFLRILWNNCKFSIELITCNATNYNSLTISSNYSDLLSIQYKRLIIAFPMRNSTSNPSNHQAKSRKNQQNNAIAYNPVDDSWLFSFRAWALKVFKTFGHSYLAHCLFPA